VENLDGFEATLFVEKPRAVEASVARDVVSDKWASNWYNTRVSMVWTCGGQMSQ